MAGSKLWRVRLRGWDGGGLAPAAHRLEAYATGMNPRLTGWLLVTSKLWRVRLRGWDGGGLAPAAHRLEAYATGVNPRLTGWLLVTSKLWRVRLRGWLAPAAHRLEAYATGETLGDSGGGVEAETLLAQLELGVLVQPYAADPDPNAV